jgi:hypothetical protein
MAEGSAWQPRIAAAHFSRARRPPAHGPRRVARTCVSSAVRPAATISEARDTTASTTCLSCTARSGVVTGATSAASTAGGYRGVRSVQQTSSEHIRRRKGHAHRPADEQRARGAAHAERMHEHGRGAALRAAVVLVDGLYLQGGEGVRNRQAAPVCRWKQPSRASHRQEAPARASCGTERACGYRAARQRLQGRTGAQSHQGRALRRASPAIARPAAPSARRERGLLHSAAEGGYRTRPTLC